MSAYSLFNNNENIIVDGDCVHLVHSWDIPTFILNLNFCA